MTGEMQALCFMAGANSLFYGERLLTTANPEAEADQALFKRLGVMTSHGDPTKVPVNTYQPSAQSAWEKQVDALAKDAMVQ